MATNDLAFTKLNPWFSSRRWHNLCCYEFSLFSTQLSLWHYPSSRSKKHLQDWDAPTCHFPKANQSDFKTPAGSCTL